jgi:hypothetical protein
MQVTNPLPRGLLLGEKQGAGDAGGFFFAAFSALVRGRCAVRAGSGP